jgi:hypothetical protein
LSWWGPSSSNGFRDAHFEFGKTYLYTVRSVAQFGADSVESGDSAPAASRRVTSFRPPRPAAWKSAIIPATPQAPAYVELSWAISSEGDLAGYYVYRSDMEDTPRACASTRKYCQARRFVICPYSPADAISIAFPRSIAPATKAPRVPRFKWTFHRPSNREESGPQDFYAEDSRKEPAGMAARPQLPGMRWFLWLRIAALRIGILTGIYLSCVFVAWLMVANRLRNWSPLPKRAISLPARASSC